MIRLVARRMAWCAAQLLLLSLLVFALSAFMPGDALTGQISPSMTGARLEEMRHQMGLDLPWTTRYVHWLAGICRGDFGVSYTHKMPVTLLARDKFINTLLLGLCSVALCFLISVPLGAVAGRFQGRWPDRLVSGGSFALMSMPQTVFGILCIFLFCYTLGWLPLGGSIDAQSAAGPLPWRIAARLRHLALPALTSATLSMPVLIQLLRAEIIAGESAGYVTALRARGLAERAVFVRHLLRNSLIPVAALSGSLLAAVLSGTVLVESIFSYPGLGKLFVDSILKRDYPVANYLIMVFALLAVLGTLLSDLLMHGLDPRVKMR